MTTLTKQLVKANWHIVEDFPPRDGDYVVCFQTDDGSYGEPDIWTFSRGTWEPVFGYTPDGEPTHWLDLPYPR